VTDRGIITGLVAVGLLLFTPPAFVLGVAVAWLIPYIAQGYKEEL